MGTVVTLDCYLDSATGTEALEGSFDAAIELLHDADATFSLWKPESPMSKVRSGALRRSDAPSAVREVLDACEVARSVSGGWFDPWALGGGVDPTGYVKGWAAQRALAPFAAIGALGAVVNAAGDVATFGVPARGQRFRVGVADPTATQRLACVVNVEGGIATSGTYERGAHLVNPHVGAHTTVVASATVCGPDLGLADALATALCVGGDDVLTRLEALACYEGLAIGFDGTWSHTAAFPFASDAS